MKNAKQPITVLSGKAASDERGVVRFVNAFDFKHIHRSYLVENKHTKYIRAFHGHFKESKYIFVVHGSILLCVVPIDDKHLPTKKVRVKRIILSSDDPKVVRIPPGYANGFRALTPHAKVVFYSTLTLAQSKNDDYRFPDSYWGEDVWKV